MKVSNCMMIGAAEGCDKVQTFDPSTGTTRAASSTTRAAVEVSASNVARVCTVVICCEPKSLIIVGVFDGMVATSCYSRSSGLSSRAEALF